MVLTRVCADDGEAEALARALSADNPDYLTVDRDGATLRFELRAAGAGSARTTLEDLLACLQAAERSRTAALESP